MLRLSKKAEYGLMAMQYIAARPGTVVSAKEIAEEYGISFELLSKVLQLLMRRDIIQSYKGVNGGYVMLLHPSSVSVADVIHAIEGRSALVRCNDDSPDEACGCRHYDGCTIRTPMQKIQERLDSVLASMSIAEMMDGAQANRTPVQVV